MAEISPLRRRMIEDMTVRNLSPATQRSYLAAVSKLSRYFGRSPDCLELEDIRAFQVHLVAIGISWPALNQIVCALRFFYGVTLGHDAIPERISYARQPSKLPVVLSADEVVRFLEAIPSLKSRTALTTVYAAGLQLRDDLGQGERHRDGSDRLHRLHLQGRCEGANLETLQRFDGRRRLLGQHYGRAVVDGADHPDAAVEEHRLQAIPIGRIVDDGMDMLG